MKLKRIYIEITNGCNLSCEFCIQKHEERRNMSTKNFEYILKQIKPFTSYIYLHILGEPLSHPDIEGILKLCQKYDFYVQITTNGTLMKKMLPILKKYKVRQYNISVHSFSQQNESMQKEYLKNIIECADILSQNSYISYRLWCMQDGELDQQAKKILDVFLKHYHTSLDICLKNHHTLAKNRFISFDDVFEWPSLDHCFVSNVGTCRGTRDMIGILSNGDVIPCCLDAYAQAKLGNIFLEDLDDILQNEKTLMIRKGFLENKLKHPLCQRCQYRTRFDN